LSEFTLATGEPAELLIELGAFPVAHKFVSPEAEQPEQTFALRLGMGKQTKLVGLIDPPPWQALTPVYPWVVCNEPEDHLDDVAKAISSFISPNARSNARSNARILGLSDKDRTLLQRICVLNGMSFDDIDMFSHPLLDEQVKPGVEVVQAAMSTVSASASEATSKATYDLVVARHILEHTSDTRAFLAKLKQLIGDEGAALIEVPDNEKAFKTGQHTVIWEEHSLYFTEFTLNALLEANGLKVLRFQRYPMALEDILIATVVSDATASNSANQSAEQNKPTFHYDQHPFDLKAMQTETQLPEQFALSFASNRSLLQAKLQRYRQQHDKIAILGAGHLGAAFVNFYQVGEFIDAVIDDDPNKQGLRLPGCQLPITSSDALNRGEFGLCLLTCNPWNNEKIAARNQGFLEAGGEFLSVFELEKWP